MQSNPGFPPGPNDPQAPQFQTLQTMQDPQHPPQPTGPFNHGPTHPRLQPAPPAFHGRPNIRVDPRQQHPVYGSRQGPHSAPPIPTPYAPLNPGSALFIPQAYSATSTTPFQDRPVPTSRQHIFTPPPIHNISQYVPVHEVAQQTSQRPIPPQPPNQNMNSTHQHTHTPTPTPHGTPAPTSAPSPQNGIPDNIQSSWQRSRAIHMCADEVLALFATETSKFREEARSLFRRMHGQLMQEREEKERLARRVRELEDELARVKGGG